MTSQECCFMTLQDAEMAYNEDSDDINQILILQS